MSILILWSKHMNITLLYVSFPLQALQLLDVSGFSLGNITTIGPVKMTQGLLILNTQPRPSSDLFLQYEKTYEVTHNLK